VPVNRRQIGAIIIVLAGVFMVVGGILAAPGSVTSSGATPVDSDPTSTATPGPSSTSTPIPSTTIIALPTSSTTPVTSTSTSIVTETPEEFLTLLVEGLRGDPELLVSRLSQATLDIYGEEQCRDTFGQILDPETQIDIREIGETGPWDYLVDDIATPLDDVLALEVQRLVGGQTIIQELHWQLVDGSWTWFSDCGEPLPG
jgi:hypothetical protein